MRVQCPGCETGASRTVRSPRTSRKESPGLKGRLTDAGAITSPGAHLMNAPAMCLRSRCERHFKLHSSLMLKPSPVVSVAPLRSGAFTNLPIP
jgi:hypothetical protein